MSHLASHPSRKASRAGPASRPRLATLGLLLATSGCLIDVTAERELSIVVTADATRALVGDSVGFAYSAEGTGLVLVWLEYGDGGADTVRVSGGHEVVDYGEPEDHANTDTLFYPGPLEVAGRRAHAFETPGTYSVVGFAVGAAGVVSDTVGVVVN